jgi:catechol 2,3-dioxygenase-like lactoylglutathione lyase family enzyme
MRVSARFIARQIRSKLPGNRGQKMPVSVRYIVDDVDAAIPFYTDMLDFKVDMHFGQAFASLSRGDLRLLLNRPGGGGGAGQSMPDGRAPAPGGWLRFQIEVPDIDATVARLKASGARLRSDVIAGRGGKQVLVDDPSGNPVELFQPG